MEIVLGAQQKIIVRYKDFEIITDQPQKLGGENSAPSPFDLFMVSIGACAGWYVKTFCQSRGLSEQGITLTQKGHYNPEKKLYDKIEIEIKLPVDFPENYIEPLIKAASACTVKKQIANAPDFEIVTVK